VSLISNAENVASLRSSVPLFFAVLRFGIFDEFILIILTEFPTDLPLVCSILLASMPEGLG
jgi:hypothetical protein